MTREIKRGYVKWTDSDGNFHKELLVNHPDLLKDASDAQKRAAEEASMLTDEEVILDLEEEYDSRD